MALRAEVEEARLIRMQLETESVKPLSQHIHDPFGVIVGFEGHHESAALGCGTNQGAPVRLTYRWRRSTYSDVELISAEFSVGGAWPQPGSGHS
jgi:hypothetical protein